MSAYSDKVIADGASAYWRLDEASGNFIDEIAGVVGTPSGGVTRGVSGALGDGNTAVTFDGSTGSIAVATGAYTAFGTGPASLELWVQATGTPSGGFAFIFGTHGSDGCAILILGNTLQFRANGTGGSLSVTDGILSNGSGWHHIVGVVERGANDTLRLYVDGILAANVSGASAGNINPTGPAYWIGTSVGNADPTKFFIGSIDEVAIYKTALTAQQVSTHFALRSLISGQAVSKLSSGIVTQLNQIIPYALPPKPCVLFCDAVSPSLSVSNDVNFSTSFPVTLAAGQAVVGPSGFIRCDSGNVNVVLKAA